MQSLVEGFNKVIPHEWIKVFSSDEIEAAICGNAHIDLEDWKNNTEIKGFNKWSITVKRFWQCMETYIQAELARILQFCTGTSRLPLGGFRSLESNRGEKAKFCIQKVPYQMFKGALGIYPKLIRVSTGLICRDTPPTIILRKPWTTLLKMRSLALALRNEINKNLYNIYCNLK